MTSSSTPVEPSSLSPVVLVLTLAAAPAIGLGIARFAYALLLPDMRADLGWTWTEAGWMNTSNAFGYLAGALLAARTVGRWGPGPTVLGGTVVCVLSLVLCAVLRETVTLNAARALAGTGAGLAFVAGGAMAAGIASRDPERTSFLLGLFYAGPGAGIALSGVLVPTTLAFGGAEAWPLGWASLAVCSVPPVAALAIVLRGERGRQVRSGARAAVGPMRTLMIGYALFGAGYIAYMTFMIAWVRDGGGTAVREALFWAIIGGGAMLSPWLWARVIGQGRDGYAFGLLCLVTAAGSALPLVLDGAPALILSGATFGCAFFSVVASTTAFVRRNYPEAQWGSAIGMLTVAFGLGQMFGPVAVGALNDASGGLSGGLIASTGLLVVGAGVGSLQRDRR